jgi:DNA-binding PadR family transcriptional regulator
LVLKAFLADLENSRYGYDIMKSTTLGPGTLYGVLKRLFDEGYLSKSAELVNGRCRVSYQLTETGIHYAERSLIEDEYEEAVRNPTGLEMEP